MAAADAFVVGAGPNGLVAALTLARAGRRVHVFEAAGKPGGGARTEELIEPGTVHDVCSAVHPLAVASPALRELDVAWLTPEIEVAHPLDGGRAGLLYRSLDRTALGLGDDAEAWRSLVGPSVRAGHDLVESLLDPFRVPPRHPVELARFGLRGLQPAARLGRRLTTEAGAGLFAGLAAHAVLPLTAPLTGAYGLLLGALGHLDGWPIPVGGAGAITDALVAELTALGGTVECNAPVARLADLPRGRPIVFDVTPRQLLAICGDALPARYARSLVRYRYGPGAFKVDYVLSDPIPWANPDVARAGTVHVGGTSAEVAAAEADVAVGRHPYRPFVLVAQPTRLDPSRSSTGRHVAWAYCHVPHASTRTMTDRIEAQIERFAPGFGDTVVGRHVRGPAALEQYNANYVGGDIGGGAADLRQFIARPALGLHPWRTPLSGVYLCSAATPPGGGVHGMGGLHAARCVLADTGG